MSDKKPTGYWTYDKCLEMAKKCHSKSELRKLCSSALNAAMKNGWINDYTWFETLWAPKWNRQACYNEAKKCTSRGQFKKVCPYGYNSARRNGWLNDYVWLTPSRVKVPNGYWTYERCYEEAQKYKTQKEFGEQSNGAYQCASRNGWMKDYDWFEMPFRWTKELCTKEAKKYLTKTDFINNNRSAYVASVKYGWLKDFTWLDYSKRPNGYWTKELCEAEARKYSTRKDFMEGNGGAFSAATKKGWINEFGWLQDQRIDLINDKIDSVYVYCFESRKVAYIGRTLIRRQKMRDREHIYNIEKDAVAQYAKIHRCSVPPMEILESQLTLKEGQERENYWIEWYRNQGYTILNKATTGIGKGSLGAISKGKWNKKACYREALKYKSSSDLEKGSPGAYGAARRNDWLKDYDWFEKRWEPKWDRETCYAEAKKYNTRGDFKKGCEGAYNKALKERWLKDYEWMPVRQYKSIGYWNNYDHCYEEAQKYQTRTEFQKGCQGAYSKALKNGWLDDYVWFREKQKRNFWNKKTCYEEARKHRYISEFQKNAQRAYQLAKENGWLEDYAWFEKLTSYWTYETCHKEAEKYTKRSHFKNGSRGAYTKARVNGWLDDYTWFEEKPKSNYWNKDTCYEEAKKYRSKSEFQKNSKGAYQKALKNGWLADYTWMIQHLHSWSYEACKCEANKYEKRGQFKRAMPGAYKKSREKGWLDDFFPKDE